MPSVADVFWVLHLGVLGVFVGGTALLLLGAILSRVRVRRPVIVWHVGPLTRVPIGPSLFLLLVAAGFAWVGLTGRHLPASAIVGYPAGGLFWFVAMWLVRTVVVTEYGVIPDVPRNRGAVAWSQVVDYVATSRRGSPHFVFRYERRRDRERSRLDVPVPETHVDAFRELLRAKLDVRSSGAEPEVVRSDVARRN